MELSEICSELRCLQRARVMALGSRNMQANRLRSLVAVGLGYQPTITKKERKKFFAKADAVVKRFRKGKEEGAPYPSIIRNSLTGIDAFDDHQADLAAQMIEFAEQLPIASWVAHKDQRGFGLLFLASTIGETGDLHNYPNPGKFWQRMGCAPWSHNGQTLMGGTWKRGKDGKLPSEQWKAFGYSPRRRSIAYLIGKNIVLQNQSGPYRARYDAAKLACKSAHPDYSKLRVDLHAMLLATKLLLKNLWIVWRGGDPAVPFHAIAS